MNNEKESKSKTLSSTKRTILTIACVLLLILSGACFYGAYYYMYENPDLVISQASDDSSTESSQSNDSAKVADAESGSSSSGDVSASSDTTDSSTASSSSGASSSSSSSGSSSGSSGSSSSKKSSQSQSSNSSSSSSSNSSGSTQQTQEVVTISIESWGSVEVAYKSGDTVYSILTRCGAPVYVEDSSYGKYIVGIGNLKEGDKGASSGWIYKVNGSMPSVSADKYKVNVGDKITWSFVN